MALRTTRNDVTQKAAQANARNLSGWAKIGTRNWNDSAGKPDDRAIARDQGDGVAGCAGANRKRVQRLMRQMGIAALGPKPGPTKPAPGQRIYPYLLRDVSIDRPNQVWRADLTYLPISRGFLYLVAVMDWASRAVLATAISDSQLSGEYHHRTAGHPNFDLHVPAPRARQGLLR